MLRVVPVRLLTPLLVLAALLVFFTLASDHHRFLTPVNLRNILNQAALLSVLATGVTLVLLTGEIDLSVAGVATLAGVLASYALLQWGWPGGAALPFAVACGAALGWANGFCTTRFRLPSFIVTLATMQISLGLALYLTKGRPLPAVPALSVLLGQDGLLLVAAVVLSVTGLILSQTRPGRYVYLVGGNRAAAELSGVPPGRVITLVMACAGALAALNGTLIFGRLGTARADGFEGLLIDSIAAVVLGGTSLTGGFGGVLNTVAGLLVFAVIKNGLNFVAVDIYAKSLLTGVVLLASLLINAAAARLGDRVTAAR